MAGFLAGISALGMFAQLAYGQSPGEPNLIHFLDRSIFIAIYTSPIVIAAGVPAFLIYQRLGLNRLAHYSVGSFVAASVVSMILFALLEFGEDDFSLRELMLFGCMMGSLATVAASTFWCVAIRTHRQQVAV